MLLQSGDLPSQHGDFALQGFALAATMFRELLCLSQSQLDSNKRSR